MCYAFVCMPTAVSQCFYLSLKLHLHEVVIKVVPYDRIIHNILLWILSYIKSVSLIKLQIIQGKRLSYILRGSAIIFLLWQGSVLSPNVADFAILWSGNRWFKWSYGKSSCKKWGKLPHIVNLLNVVCFLFSSVSSSAIWISLFAKKKCTRSKIWNSIHFFIEFISFGYCFLQTW